MTLSSSVQAFEAARERASIAQALQMAALHRVIREAREAFADVEVGSAEAFT